MEHLNYYNDSRVRSRDHWYQTLNEQALTATIEYVVKGDESEETLERLVKRGITPIRVERTKGSENLFEKGGEQCQRK